mgnify:CR=1 FL=1
MESTINIHTFRRTTGQTMDGEVDNAADGDTNGLVKRHGGTGVPAKGILKSIQQPESLPPSQTAGSQSLIAGNIQLPQRGLSKADVLDGNNTTSRIDTLSLQERSNRRVSFAPDVTLHSFDFVPETRTSFREPRRKATDLVVTSTQQENSDEEDGVTSQSMDLTSPVAISTQPYMPVFDQEVSMEITQLFAKHDEPQEKEETMDFTGIPVPVAKTVENVENGENTMELTAIHDSEKGPEIPATPPSSKRRKLNPEPRSPMHESSDDQDMELSMMERMSPIKLKPTEPQVETVESHSLREFIDETGVSFMIDTDLIDKRRNPITFKTIDSSQREKFRINQLLYALYLDTPVLEMNAFICKELLRRITQSKKQFDDLDEQVSSAQSQPLLFTEYFTSSQEMRQLMNQQLQLVKSYSKLEAKKSWYEWRTQHLNGIKTVLHENLLLLEEDRAKVRKSLNRVQDLKVKAQNLRNSIKKEIARLKENNTDDYQEEPSLNERVNLETLKQELASYSLNINNRQELTKKDEQLKEEIERKKEQLFDLKEQLTILSQKHNMRLEKKNFTEYDVVKCRNKLQLLSIISGVEFVRYQNTELTIGFPYIASSLQISVDLSNLNAGNLYSYEVIQPAETALLFKYCYRSTLRNVLEMPSKHPLSLVALGAKSSIAIIKELHMLKLLFPVQLQHKEKEILLEIMDYDLRSSTKAIYDVALTDFVRGFVEGESEITVKATVIENGHLLASTIPITFVKKVARILPWFDESRVKISVLQSA